MGASERCKAVHETEGGPADDRPDHQSVDGE